jgi:MFS family permease
LFTLKEPRRTMRAQADRIAAASATFGQTMGYLLKRRTFWFIAFAAAIKAFIGYGHAPFTASFFLRNHGPEVQDLATSIGLTLGYDLKSVGFLGLALGVMSGVAGAIGSVTGGWIADKYGRRDLRAYMVAPAIASLLTIPVYISALTIDSALLALLILPANYFLGALWYGPVYGTGQSVVPPHMRATAAAILLFIINLIGLGLGPLAVGLLSDYFNKGLGMGAAEGVRWALIASTLFGLVAFACFWTARRTIREDTVS